MACKVKSDQQRYRYEVVPVGDDSGKTFLLFESRYYAEKYLVEKLLSREVEFSVDGKFDLIYQISKADSGYVIMAIAKAIV